MGVVALTGAAGGAGTTRLSVEAASHLTARGESTVVVDVDFATQGLADYVPEQVTTDVTEALCDRTPLTDVTASLAVDHTPRPRAVPSFAGLSRVAAAMEAGCAKYLGEQLTELADAFDHVLLDTPVPVTNPAIAAVTTADTVAVVFPRSPRGIESLHRTEGFLHDIDVAANCHISTAAPAAPAVEDPADIAVAQLDRAPPRAAPTTLDGSPGSETIEVLTAALTE